MSQKMNRTNREVVRRLGPSNFRAYRKLSRAARLELAAAQEEDIKVSIFGSIAEEIAQVNRRSAILDQA